MSGPIWAMPLGSAALRLGALRDGELVGAMLVSSSTRHCCAARISTCRAVPSWTTDLARAGRALRRRAEQEARSAARSCSRSSRTCAMAIAVWLDALAELGFQRNPYATHPRRSWVLDIRPNEERCWPG